MKPLALSLSIAAAVLAVPVAANPVVITAERYLDVTKGSYVEHPAIYVDDAGRITQIADARTIKPGNGKPGNDSQKRGHSRHHGRAGPSRRIHHSAKQAGR